MIRTAAWFWRRKSEYRYDLLNRQTYVKTLDGKEQENSYDGEGLRAGLTVNGKKTTFLFHNGEILAECDVDSAPIRRYVRGNGLFCVQTLDNNAYHAYHQDEQGSTAYITGPDNAAENCYQYDAFGNLTEKKEGIENRIFYTGQQYDQETGQYYLRARYYNPVVGRFLQEDTYRGDGLNLYAYCANNPVIYFDPSGHSVLYGQEGPENNVNPQLITSQSELTKEYFDSLQPNGSLEGGGRSGGQLPPTAPPNSYYTTNGGRVIIYGEDGKKVMEISPERIKIFKFNQNPNNPDLGKWSDRKLKDISGAIEKTAKWIKDYFGLK